MGDLLPSTGEGPEAAYARTVLLEELDAALEELPEEQRDVFVAHEMEGRSFKELSAATGVSVNTLLSRKRYAVLQLRLSTRNLRTNEDKDVKSFRVLRVLKITLFGAVALTVVSFVVMSLWNALMPSIFAVRAIGFWQALGLLILSKILFGGFRHFGGPGSRWRRRMWERWEQMTPEEREKFKQGMRHGCGRVENTEAPSRQAEVRA